MTCAEELELEREEHRNDEEKFFSILADSIVQNDKNSNSDSTLNTTMEIDVSSNPVVVNGIITNEDSLEEFSMVEDDDDDNTEEINSVFSAIVNDRNLGPVRKVPVFMITLNCEIEKKGLSKLTKKNLVTIRKRKNQRKERHSKFMDKLFEKITSKMDCNDFNTSTTTIVQNSTLESPLFTMEERCLNTFLVRMHRWQMNVSKYVTDTFRYAIKKERYRSRKRSCWTVGG